MWLLAPILSAFILAQQPVAVPIEAQGLHILWVPSAMAGLSNEAPGFKVLDPLTLVEKSFPKAEDLKPILETLPLRMKENGIWISTSNSFLYVADEKLQLKALVEMARTNGIPVFICELGEQPGGWKRIESP